MNNLKENCILGIDFLSQNNVKINTKNKQLNYDHAAAEQILETDTLYIASQSEMIELKYHSQHMIDPIISLGEGKLKYPMS